MLDLFSDVSLDACLISGGVSGCLPCAPLCYLASGGSKISKKHVLWPRLGGQRSQKQHVPGKQTRIYSI